MKKLIASLLILFLAMVYVSAEYSFDSEMSAELDKLYLATDIYWDYKNNKEVTYDFWRKNSSNDWDIKYYTLLDSYTKMNGETTPFFANYFDRYRKDYSKNIVFSYRIDGIPNSVKVLLLKYKKDIAIYYDTIQGEQFKRFWIEVIYVMRYNKNTKEYWTEVYIDS